jgi:phosphoglycolate phosphatase-like HAD superfamily hydrolase
VDFLTGKQTIFQCIKLAEEVVARGGDMTDPGEYKAEYLRRLGIRIKNRLEALLAGCDPQPYLVPGSTRFLDLLKKQGCNLYLASGTDEPDVLAEAKLLGLDRYFGKHIYGARDNETACSKETVIKQIIKENNLTGAELVSFGDGFVEIELVVGIGGYSIGVATDEVRKQGVNQHKRKRLLEAGAAMIIPDFRVAEDLMAFLTGAEKHR